MELKTGYTAIDKHGGGVVVQFKSMFYFVAF